MDLHPDHQTILQALHQGSRQALVIPESERLAIPAKPFIAPYLQTMKEFADRYRDKPIPSLPYSTFKLFYETGDRTQYQGSETGYFPRRGRLAAFAALSWLYGRKEDLDELCNVIWAICDEYTWALPAHLSTEPDGNAFIDKLECSSYTVDLFAAETGQALSEILFLLGDKLPRLIRTRVNHELNCRIFDRIKTADHIWLTKTNNWSAVCAGSVGMAAIYAIEEEELLAAVLARILPAFSYFLSGFAQDGSCLEGISYWSYGVSYYVSFADLLYRRTAGQLDLFDDPLVEKIAGFQQKCYFPGGRTVSFSDGSSRSSYFPGLTSYLSKKYKDVLMPPASCCAMRFNNDGCYRWTNVLHDLLWTVPEHKSDALPPRTSLLPAAQWYLSTAPNGMSLAAKAGNNDEPHNHNDIGSFQIFLNGEELLADLGSGEYTRQYFSAERYNIFVCGSQGHSVPLIDGCTQKNGPDACARDVQLTPDGISMEYSAAYPVTALQSLTRDIRFDGTVRITDTFRFAQGQHEITERFITPGHAQTEPGLIRISCGGQSALLRYDPAVFAVRITSAGYSSHGAQPMTCTVVDLTARAEEALTARFTIEPVLD